MVKDASDEMKHAVANQNLCCVGFHFCGENGERLRAAAMGKGEEDGGGCFSSGGVRERGEEREAPSWWRKGGDEKASSDPCVKGRGKDEEDLWLVFAACTHAPMPLKGIKRE